MCNTDSIEQLGFLIIVPTLVTNRTTRDLFEKVTSYNDALNCYSTADLLVICRFFRQCGRKTKDLNNSHV